MKRAASKRHPWRSWSALTAVIVLTGCLVAGYAYRGSMNPPAARLALDATYDSMPPDARHHYLNLPLDYDDPGGNHFRDFYILSPGFRAGGPVVFFLTDGQMELVSPTPDFAFFESELPDLSYVLIGHRGHSPTLFPEVYPSGSVDLRRAMKLYGSDSRVEDIERVRRDMVRLSLLPADGRIMIFAASGAGILAQQYLQRYGDHVSRVLLASTGAPDLSSKRGWDYARSFEEFDSTSAAALSEVRRTRSILPANLGYMLFQLGRQGGRGRAAQRRVLEGLRSRNLLPYAWYWLHPSLNWPLARKMLQMPAADAIKVRMFELLGADLQRPGMATRTGASPLYVWASELLADYLNAPVAPPEFLIDRSLYRGEVLVVTGLDDIVFSPDIGRAIATEYPDGRFIGVRGGHRLELDRDYHVKLRTSFFNHGLHAPETVAFLTSPPAG